MRLRAKDGPIGAYCHHYHLSRRAIIICIIKLDSPRDLTVEQPGETGFEAEPNHNKRQAKV